MRELERFEVPVPDWALPYLVNGDASGLSDADSKSVNDWLSEFERMAKEQGGHVLFCPGSEEGYFRHHPAFGLSCNCVDSVILILAEGGGK